MRLLHEPDGYTVDIVRVDPTDAHVPDPWFWKDRDHSVFLVEDAMGDRNVLRLRSVRRSIMEWVKHDFPDRDDAELMTDVHILSALDHPDTPLGVRFTNNDVDWPPGVVYRGEFYTREANGSLTAWGERDPNTPTRAQWAASVRVAEAYLKAVRP
ncbi:MULTISPECIES: hypothetical protein [unclassified Nocardioides]|uniref:hypothetical protein n=1 Tax=unclassified Nocardioides TaxID=2615069 RepID=UPI00361DB9D8